MRNPENVLNSLIRHSKDTNYQYDRLYRILYDREMYLAAYQKIYANEGNMTAGTDTDEFSETYTTMVPALTRKWFAAVTPGLSENILMITNI